MIVKTILPLILPSLKPSIGMATGRIPAISLRGLWLPRTFCWNCLPLLETIAFCAHPNHDIFPT